ncbi:MAG: PDZ domain-containing protein [Phycisphaerales bacterium]|nr:MAG: PDZ domain-containing protein [Phycisphaerales bacterium]
MTISQFNRIMYRWLPGIAAAVALLGATSPLWAADEEKAITRAYTVTTTDGGDTKVENQAISIQMEDDDIKVIINGEVIPLERIKREGERIIILDEDGEEMESVPMIMHLGKGAWSFDSDEMLRKVWTGMGDYQKALEKYRAFDNYEELIEQYRPYFDSLENFKVLGAADAPTVMMGVVLDKPGEALCKHLNLDADAVTMIADVYEGLPADEAGLEQYDVIIKLDGKKPADPEVVHELLADAEPGDVVELTVIQAGKRKSFEIELAPYDAEAMRKDILIGKAPGALTWSFGSPEGMRFFRPEELAMPQIERFIFKPEGRDEMIQQFVMPKIEVMPDVKTKLRDHLRQLGKQEEGEQDKELEQVNEQLSERLAELEKTLEKLRKRLEEQKD